MFSNNRKSFGDPLIDIEVEKGTGIKNFSENAGDLCSRSPITSPSNIKNVDSSED